MDLFTVRALPSRALQFVRALFVTGSLVVGITGSAPAQWNDPETNTPSLVQTNFGPYGSSLPGNGESYCGPTSLTMALYWASSNGFTQLAPSSYNPSSPTDQAAALNLELVIAGLCGTSSNGGTYGTGMSDGMDTYLAAMGISKAQYSTAFTQNPDLNWLSTNFAGNLVSNPQTLTFQYFSVGWYNDKHNTSTTWTNEGGHVLDPLSVDLANSTVTINNAYPAAFENVPNLPAYNPQTVGMTQVPSGLTIDDLTNISGGLPSQDYSQIQSPFLQTNPADDSTFLGDNTHNKAVLWGSQYWSIDISALPGSSGYTVNSWKIDSAKAINTNGGNFTVLAPMHGAGGLTKEGDGALILTNSNALTGDNIDASGTLVSTVTSGTPFGTGSMTLKDNAVLEVRPDDTTPTDVTLQVASGTESQLILDAGGGTFALTKGNNTSLTVTLGGNTDGTTSNIVRNNFGTLIIAPDAGLSALGNSIKLLVAGSGSNLPPVVHGIVSPSIVGQDTDADRSGAFLTYSGTNGFTTASTVLSSNVDINDPSVDNTTVYEANTNQSIVSGNTVAVHALQIDGATLGENQSGSTIQIGGQATGDVAGVILNGGTISTSNVQFGQAEGAIYTSLANGTINSQINGSHGMTKFGPGSLTITANNSSSLSGSVTINGGTLVAANTSGSATGSGEVRVYSNSTLQINSSASVSGSISVSQNATLNLNGGTAGQVTVAAVGSDTSQPGGILEGNGTITGTATVGGLIKASPNTGGTIEFQNAANLEGSQFFWQPNALVDNSNSSAGTGWNSLTFDLPTDISTSGDNLTFYLDFSLIQGPDSGNSYWNTTHSWTVFSFPSSFTGFYYSDGNFTFQAGNFNLALNSADTLLTLNFAPAPEPGTWVLLASGLVGLALLRRHSLRRSKRLA